ncbi:hypothetical protein ACFX13_042473 [Malus domestica]|nr:uncharacterized protein LOC103439613 [Malus domestica]
MMFGGRSMGGGGGGGSMFKAVSRAAVTRTIAGGPPIQEPLSSSSSSAAANTTTTNTTATSTSRHNQKPSSSHNLSLSSPTSPFSSCNIPLASNCGTSSWPSSPRFDDFDWVTVDNGVSSEDDERLSHGLMDDFVLGPVPSKHEVHNAVSALHQVFSPFIRDKFGSKSDRDVDDQITSPAGFVHPAPSAGSELDWMEPSAYLSNNSKMLQSHGVERVYDAFHLLQTESSVQRMVMALSSDTAVWDAVMNNEVVRELRESFYADEDNSSESSQENSDDNNDKATNIVKWIFQNTMAKVMEAVEKITKVMGGFFQPPSSENAKAEASNRFEDKLKISFMLSVVVLLIVVVTRSHKA